MTRRKQTQEGFDEQPKVNETYRLLASLIGDDSVARTSTAGAVMSKMRADEDMLNSAAEDGANEAGIELIEPIVEDREEPIIAEDRADGAGMESMEPIAEDREEPPIEVISAKEIESLEPILSEEQYLPCQMTVRCRFKEICDAISDSLSEEELDQFRKTQFGHLLDVPTHHQLSSQLLWFFLLRQIKIKKEKEMWMMVNKTPMRLSMTEFALITGLKFSGGANQELVKTALEKNRLRDKYFEGHHTITVNVLKELLASLAPTRKPPEDINDDRVKLALVLFVVGVLKAQDYNREIDINLLAMADNIELFDSCDWGVQAYLWILNSFQKLDLQSKIEELNNKGGKKRLSFTVYGFVHVIQTWAYEMVPTIASKYAQRRGDFFPRILRWQTNQWKEKCSPEYKEIESLFEGAEIRSLLVPTVEERNCECISTAIVLNDNEDSAIDELVRKLSTGAKIQHDSVGLDDDSETYFSGHRVVTPIPSPESRGDSKVPIRARNRPKIPSNRVPAMTSESAPNSVGLDIHLKASIDEKFVQMESQIKAFFTTKIGDLHDKLGIIIARQDTRCHCMSSEVIEEDHVDSNNVNDDFNDIIAEADDREYYITPSPSEINDNIEGCDIAPDENINPTGGEGRKRLAKPSAVLQHSYTDPCKRGKFRQDEGV